MQSESALQSKALATCGHYPDVLLLRNNVGQAVFTNQRGDVRRVPYGLGVGSPDLIGWKKRLDGSAAFFAIELKVPGKFATEEQRKVHSQWRAFGALVRTCTTVEECVEFINEIRRDYP